MAEGYTAVRYADDGYRQVTYPVERYATWTPVTREQKATWWTSDLTAAALGHTLHGVAAQGFVQLPGSDPLFEWHEITAMEAELAPYPYKGTPGRRAGDWILRCVVKCIPREAVA